MSACTQWVDQGVIGCKAWADEKTAQCGQWADEGSNQCSRWADEGSNQCSRWADEGSNRCCNWWPCSWFCDAYYWVAKWVCKAYYWVAKWVCKAWYWVAKWVCKVWFWIVKAVCTVWGWIAKLVCVAWGAILCAVNAVLAPFRRAKRRPKIRKVFVLMLENRSFDHMLGFAQLQGTDALSGQPTTANDFAGKDLTQPPFTNIDPGGGSAIPTHPAAFAIASADKDPPHEFKDVFIQLTGAWDENTPANNVYSSNPDNSGFIASYRRVGAPRPKSVMECYGQGQVPVLTALAREFAVCDTWFSSMPGPTWPNRFFVHAASSGGLDDSPDGLETTVSELIDGYRFANGTLFDRLDDSCIDWRVFEGDELPQVFAISGMNLNALAGHYTDFEEFAADVGEEDFEPAYVFIEPNYGNILPTTAGDFTCGNSQHPLDDVTRGERLIKDVYEAIRKSPHWDTSALVVTYDEHGGFFDSVSPPAVVAPGDPISSAANNHHNFDFQRLGVRVPAVVVSPLIPRGTIDHTRYDHTSIIRTVSRLFGLRSLTARDAAANDFLHLFSLKTPRRDTPVRLPSPADSGFTCEQGLLTDLVDSSDLDDEDRSGAESSGAPLSGAPAGPAKDDDVPGPPRRPRQPTGRDDLPPRPVPSSFWGFMRVALRKSLLVIPVSDRAERRRVLNQYLAVRTEADARRFIHQARMRVRRSRHPDREWRPLRMRRGGGDAAS